MIGILLSALLGSSAAAAPVPADPVEKFWSLHDSGKTAEAFYFLRAKLKRHPEDPALHRAYQITCVNTGQLEALAAEYETFFSSNPTDLNAYFLANAQPSVRESRAVIERARRAGVKGPYLDWASASFQAYDLLSAGKPEAAATKLKASEGARLDPFLWELSIAQTWLQRGGPAAATEHVARARAAQPRDIRGLEAEAWLRLIAGDVMGYGRTLDEAGKLGDGNFAFLHDARAYEHLLYGDLDKMRAENEATLASPAGWTNDACYRISALSGTGRGEEASSLAQSEYAADPAQTCAVPALVGALLREGRPEDALAFAEKASARNPLDLSVLSALSVAQGARGRYLDMAATGRKALRQAPKHPSLLTAVGAAYAGNKQCDLAERYFMKAFNVTNNLPELNREYGGCRLERRDFEGALDHFSRLRRSGAEPRQAWWGLARAYEGTGRLDRAVAAMEKALSLDQDPVFKAKDKADLARLRLDADGLDRHFSADGAAVKRRLKRVPALAERRVAAFAQGGAEWLGVPWEDKPIARSEDGEQRGEGQKWSPDGRRVFYILPDGVVSLDLLSGTTSYVVRHPHQFRDKRPGLRRAVVGVLVSKDGRRLYALSSRYDGRRSLDDTVESIDLATGKEAPLRGGAEKAVRDSADGAAFGSVGRIVLSLPGEPSDPPETVCGSSSDVSPDGRVVCVAEGSETAGADDDALAIYDPKTRKKEYLGAAGSFPVWSPDGRKVAYLWRERELRVYDADKRKIEALDSGFSPDFVNPDGLMWARKRPQWTPDSRFIMYTLGSVREGERDHPGIPMTLIADLGRAEVWASDGSYFDFVWSPSTAPYASPR
ncbi:MAG: tetratricopeptide repeat protein [Elusimicrobia bacterium]|nr:tetratricopeptide repeat protein [Elusimicrobiota bacterium]